MADNRIAELLEDFVGPTGKVVKAGQRVRIQGVRHDNGRALCSTNLRSAATFSGVCIIHISKLKIVEVPK